MKNFRAFGLFVVALFAFVALGAEPRVLLISIDGLHPSALTAQHAPTLLALAAEGSHAEKGMVPAYPSLTFPNHYTLVTGLAPEKHGIVANEMRDPKIARRFSLGDREVANDPRWWIGEPLWVTAQKQGRRSGTMFWPGSEVVIRGVRPTYSVAYDGSMPNDARVAQVLAWLDLPVEQRPHFLTLYFEEVDNAGHRYGPASPENKTAVANVDAALAKLVAGLKSRGIYDAVDLVVVSDHGMAPIDPARVVYVGDVLKEFPDVETIGGGAQFGAFSKDPTKLAALQTRLRALSPYLDVYLKSAIPARYQYRASDRIPDLLVVAKESAYVTTRANSLPKGGTHGYDNELESMRAVFLARGPQIKPGVKLAPFANAEVYALLCRLLGVRPVAEAAKAKPAVLRALKL